MTGINICIILGPSDACEELIELQDLIRKI